MHLPSSLIDQNSEIIVEFENNFTTESYDENNKKTITNTKTLVISGNTKSILLLSNQLIYALYENIDKIKLDLLQTVKYINCTNFKIDISKNILFEENLIIQEGDREYTWLIGKSELKEIILEQILPLSYESSHCHICNNKDIELFIESI